MSRARAAGHGRGGAVGFADCPRPLPPLQSVSVEIFTAGDGIRYPKKGQTVTIHYTGYLRDGTQWDSSRDRGKPFKFKLGAEQVIPGVLSPSLMPHRALVRRFRPRR